MKRTQLLRLAISFAALIITTTARAQTMPTQTTSSNGAATMLAPVPSPTTNAAVRPFSVRVSDDQLADLRRRIAMTRWPDKETVADGSQGIQLAKLQELVKYWGTGYDWRRIERKLATLPQFVTNIDGVDVQFIQVKSKEKNALPIIITHGWPGSVLELTKVIGPLTDPVAHGGTAADAFDVVIPSIPGYGFSSHPREPWSNDRRAAAWDVLMKRLGYARYVAQGGDAGAAITEAIGRLAPPGLLGIHINLPAVFPPEVERALGGGPMPTFTPKERAAFAAAVTLAKSGNTAYSVMMTARPQTIGYVVGDSPAGLAAWMLGHPGFASWTYGANDPEKPRDEVLDDITLYWVTNSGASASRLYWEGHGTSRLSAAGNHTSEIKVPVAVTAFPQELYVAPETWTRRAYPNVIYFHEAAKGGHFAAWEQPEIFAAEIRAAFKSLR